MPIDMKGTLSTFEREEDRALCYKDAVFISPHKYIGGPDTPGILLVRKELLRVRTPANVGGGIVFFVDQKEHIFVHGVEEREEAGTQSIIGVIRAGLVFLVQQKVGFKEAEKAQKEIMREVHD